MEAPPAPPKTKAFQHYLWVTKLDFITWMQTFKDGAFKDRVNWSVKLFDIFDLLLYSGLLDKDEKGLIAAQALAIIKLQDDLKAGQQKSYEDMIMETGDVDWALAGMIEHDAKKRGEDSMTKIQKAMGIKDEDEAGKEWEIEDHGEVTMFKKKNFMSRGAGEASAASAEAGSAGEAEGAGKSLVTDKADIETGAEPARGELTLSLSS